MFSFISLIYSTGRWRKLISSGPTLALYASHNTLERNYYHAHFVTEKTKAQRD